MTVTDSTTDLTLDTSYLTLNPHHPTVRRALIDVHYMHVLVSSGWRHAAFPGESLRTNLSILFAVSTAEDMVRLVAQGRIPAHWDHLDATMLVTPPQQRAVRPPLEGEVAFQLTAAPTYCPKSLGGRRVPIPAERRDPWGRDALLSKAGLEVAELTVSRPQMLKSESSVPRHMRRTPNSVLTHTAITYTGHGRIVDPDRHQEALVNGIGRGKAYGCGLLLTRARRSRPVA